jgi:IS30 family transposase
MDMDGNYRGHKNHKKPYKYLRHTGRRQKRKNIKDNRGAIKGRVAMENSSEIVA